MYTDYDIYTTFRRVQSLVNGKPYRLPKDWNTQKSKMTEQNLNALERAAGYFNTTYSSVDLETYIRCGFELYKGFTYTSLLKKEVLQHYIQKDKTKKRQLNTSQDQIINTFDNISSYMSNKRCHPGYTKLQSFCKFKNGEVRDIVNLYNKDKVDQMTLIYCISNKYMVLSDSERALIPYITQRYRELLDNLYDVKEFIQEKERELESK